MGILRDAADALKGVVKGDFPETEGAALVVVLSDVGSVDVHLIGQAPIPRMMLRQGVHLAEVDFKQQRLTDL